MKAFGSKKILLSVAIAALIITASLWILAVDRPSAAADRQKGQPGPIRNGSINHPARAFFWAEASQAAALAGQQYSPDAAARTRNLAYLLLGFMMVLVLVGGWKGITTIFTLFITAAGIAGFLLPALLAGRDAVSTSVLVCASVAATALVINGGLTVKTLAAAIGTTGGVVAAGILASVASRAVALTPMDIDDLQVLSHLPQGAEIDLRGVLFAGMIIGALGAVMDVGMSISSAMQEVKNADPRITGVQLFSAGMNVGRDIMSTMANTLILAYTGSAIPLLLLLTAHRTPLERIVGMETVTTELVRILAGSIGLILCIPVTAAAASLMMNGRR